MYICKYLSFLLFIKIALLAYLPVYVNAQVVDDNPTGNDLTGNDLTGNDNGGVKVDDNPSGHELHNHCGVKVDDNPSGHELNNNCNNRTSFDDSPSGTNSTRSSNSGMINGISIGAIFAIAFGLQYL
jgi:hypothetical protein